MRVVARFFVIVLCAAALVTLAGAGGGCGGGSGGPGSQWERVTTAQVSGDKPVRLHLGNYPLGDRVRLAWDLSGPENPPVTLTLRIIDVKTGRGYGYAVTPESEGHALARQDNQAILLALVPGDYRIYFSQRFRPTRGPGYDIELTLYTKRVTP
jgi:hypothetical protein